MPVWRNARLRRLYGKPDDPIEAPPVGVSGSRTRNLNKGDANSGNKSAESTAPPAPTPPPPKRIKREKTRPESEYELVHNMPVTPTTPDYSLLTNPLTEQQSNVVAYAIHSSRQNWLSGSMFETFWTRKPRGKKIADGQVNLREKMTKLFECTMTLGPHTFPVRLFTVRDDNVHLDEEADKVIEEQLAKEKAKEKAEAEAISKTKESQNPESKDSESIDMESQNLESKNPESKDSESINATPSTEPSGSASTIKTVSSDQQDLTVAPSKSNTEQDKDIQNSPSKKEATPTAPAVEDAPKPVATSDEKESLKQDKVSTQPAEERPQEQQPELVLTETAQTEKPEQSLKESSAKPDESSAKESGKSPVDTPSKVGEDKSDKPSSDNAPQAPAKPPKRPPRKRKRPSKAANKGETDTDSKVLKPSEPQNSAQTPEMINEASDDNKTTHTSPAKARGENSESSTNPHIAAEKESLQVEKEKNAELERKLGGDGKEGAADNNGATEGPSVTAAPNTQPSTATTEGSAAVQSTIPSAESGAAPSAEPATGPTVEPTSGATAGSAVGPAAAPNAMPPSAQPLPQQPVYVPQPQASPSQLVIYRLQQMAARDPSLSELMKHVASGTAPPDSIAKFQEVINRVKASLFAPPPPPAFTQRKSQGPKVKPQSAPQQPKQTHVQRPAPIYHPRANAKAVMLAIEFDECPTDRYLLPKRSIIEYVPQNGDLLWSFLHMSEPQARDEKKKYTPITAVFHGIPLRIAQTLERCVRKPEVVAVYMKQAMAEAERSEPWHIWFQIEKNDEVLLDLIKKTGPPYLAPPAPPKRPTKPRKPRGPTPAQLEMQRNQERMQQLQLQKRGQPLEVPKFFQLVLGQPFIRAPSTWQPFPFRRAFPQRWQAQPLSDASPEQGAQSQQLLQTPIAQQTPVAQQAPMPMPQAAEASPVTEQPSSAPGGQSPPPQTSPVTASISSSPSNENANAETGPVEVKDEADSAMDIDG